MAVPGNNGAAVGPVQQQYGSFPPLRTVSAGKYGAARPRTSRKSSGEDALRKKASFSQLLQLRQLQCFTTYYIVLIQLRIVACSQAKRG